ncbi:MAG: outer membrane beta-barrel protein, partial [Xanthomonadales bacterium]|nr:outer membrane beta-barrel protein [Xanthomonadales bacterium]
YSLSNLFGFGPFYHTGVKLDYSVSDNIGLMVGLANGWDAPGNATADNNEAKSALAQVSLVDLVPGLSIYLNYVGGAEQAGSETKMRHIGDLTAAMGLTDQLSIGLNAAYGTDYKNLGATNESNEAWYGAALYIDFTLNPGEETTHMISTRAEYFNDNTGVRGHGARVMGITGTYTLSMYGGSFMIKPEVRYDVDLGKSSAFYTRNANSQTTAMVAFIGTY